MLAYEKKLVQKKLAKVDLHKKLCTADMLSCTGFLGYLSSKVDARHLRNFLEQVSLSVCQRH